MTVVKVCIHGRHESSCRDCAEYRATMKRRADQLRDQRRKADGRTRSLWQRIRKTVLDRDGYTCKLDLPGCTARATTVHRWGGGWHDGTDLNLYSAACRECHGRIDGAARRNLRTKPLS